jgi:hypothetical protein
MGDSQFAQFAQQEVEERRCKKERNDEIIERTFAPSAGACFDRVAVNGKGDEDAAVPRTVNKTTFARPWSERSRRCQVIPSSQVIWLRA